MADELNSKKGSDIKEKKNKPTFILIIIVAVIFIVVVTKLMKEEKKENPEKVVHEETINVPPAEKTQIGLPPLPVPKPVEQSRNTGRRQPSPDQMAVGRLMAPSVIMNKNSQAVGSEVSVTSAKNKSLDPDSVWANAIESSGVKVSAAKQQTDLQYKILQGKRFNGVLTHAINSDLPGMAVAEISQPIYGEMGTEVLLPKGTRLVGQYNTSIKKGQTRLFFVWQRAITPAGIDIDISSTGADRLGQSGLTGDVDTHFWEMFGTSVLLSSMAAGVSSIGGQGLDANQYQSAVGESFIDASGNRLEANTNIKPTIHIEQGTIINIVAAKDLDFSTIFKSRREVVF